VNLSGEKANQTYLKFLLELRLGNRINDDSRKGAKDAKFGENRKIFSLRAWRLGAKNLVKVVLSNILSVRI